MISDITQRYVLGAANKQLWRYDARWRTYRSVDVSGGKDFDIYEGSEFIAVVVHEEERARTEVTVRSPETPENAHATAIFEHNKWQFSGPNQAWTTVPEYILVPQGETHRGLLRIAEGADVDPLEGCNRISDVIHVPESRLVILLGEGNYIIYDPVARRALFNHELADKNPAPTARFRNKEELWINDVDTMVKIDSKKFEPIDAAGSEGLETADGADKLGRFGKWTFAAAGELCVVTRPLMGDVLVLDVVSMLPVAHGTFRSDLPVDAMMVGRNTVVALSTEGVPLRTRLRRVKMPADLVAERNKPESG